MTIDGESRAVDDTASRSEAYAGAADGLVGLLEAQSR